MNDTPSVPRASGASRTASTITCAERADAAGVGDRQRVRQIYLAFSPEPSARSLATLDDAPLVLGRLPGEGGLIVPDREVSRAHARVELDASGALHIVDLGSRNGMHVDGVTCKRAPLRHGTVIRLGASMLLHVDVAVRSGELMRGETGRLLGYSVAMQRVRGDIELIARRPTSVLILGETGVGKELVAEQIHEQSGRRGRFVAVNCAAIAEGVAESELFGHIAGAFTGAAARTDGLFTAADGGTLFLDEVGELPAPLQAKLLRALETGEIRPVGTSAAKRVDVRVIAATHRDLHADVAKGSFRADLLARLAGWTIEIPPLRARREDILRLADGLMTGHSLWRPIAPSAAEALLLHDWPYNVRELRQTLHAAVVRAQRADALRLEHLPDALAARVLARGSHTPSSTPTPARLQVGVGLAGALRKLPPPREELLRLLAQCHGNVQLVADYYGKDRRQVYRWLEKEGIDPGPLRSPRG